MIEAKYHKRVVERETFNYDDTDYSFELIGKIAVFSIPVKPEVANEVFTIYERINTVEDIEGYYTRESN